MGSNCTPRNLAELAGELAKPAGSFTNAHLRAACSRAYYAAYHALEPILTLVPGDPKGVGAQGRLKHREIPRRMRNLRLLPQEYARLRVHANAARVLALTYQAALASREDADYLMHQDIEKGEVDSQLERMEDLLVFAEMIQSELARLRATHSA